MPYFSRKSFFALLFIVEAASFSLSGTQTAYAAASIGPCEVSVSPSGEQVPGTSYTVSGKVCNTGSNFNGNGRYQWSASGGGWSWTGPLGTFGSLGADDSFSVSGDVSGFNTVGTAYGVTYSWTLCANSGPPSYTSGGCTSAGSITVKRPPTYTVTGGTSGTGSGTVSGGGTVDSGASATLTATASSNSNFTDWSSCSGTASGNTCSFTNITSDQSGTANFNIKTFSVDAEAIGSGSGTISGTGTVNYGGSATLTATASGNSNFGGWSSCTGSVSGNTCSFSNITSSQSGKATFNIKTYSVSSGTSGAGSGTVSGGGTANYGSSATLTATADTSSNFTEWSSCSGTASGNTCSSTNITSNQSGTANFTPKVTYYDISAGVSTSYCTGCGHVAAGTSVSVTASPPQNGYQISGWNWSTGGSECSAGVNPCNFNAYKSGTLTPSYSATPASLSIGSMSVCDASSGGNCGTTLYAGRGYYHSSVTNSGGTAGTFTGEFQYKYGTGAWQAGWMPAGSYSISPNGGSQPYDKDNGTSPVSGYSFRFCQTGTSNCSGSVSPIFISRPTLGVNGGATSVPSGSSLTFTASYDSAQTPTFSNYTCGTGGSLSSSNGASFTCSYNNSGASGFSASPSVTVAQGGISTSASATVTVNPIPSPAQPWVSVSQGSCGGGINLSYGGGSGGTTFTLYRNTSDTIPYAFVQQASSLASLRTTDTGTAGQTYFYYVDATNVRGTTSSTRPSSATAGGSCFDYTLNPPASVPTLVQGSQAVIYISTSLTSTATQAVTIALSGLPSGVTASVATNGQNPSATYEVTLTATGSATTGTKQVTVTGTSSGATNRTTTFNLTVAVPTVSATLTARNSAGTVVTSAVSNETLTFTTSVTGTATGDVTYSGQSCGGGNILGQDPTRDSFSCTYPSTGTKTATITATKQGVSSVAINVISVTAPPNTLRIQTNNNGSVAEPGALVEFRDTGAEVTTTYTQSSPYIIDTSLIAPITFQGNIFLGWSGCDSVTISARRCFIYVSNGATKTPTANYGTTNYQPKLSAGTGSIQVDGARFKEKPSVYATNEAYEDNVYMVATFSNLSSAKYSADNVSVSFEYSTDNGANYFPAIIKAHDLTLPISSIPIGGSAKAWAGVGLPPNVYLVRACAKPSNAVASTCTPGMPVTVENAPPPPPSPCMVFFSNKNTSPGDDISTRVTVTKTGCASDRWINQYIDERALVNDTANRVLDIDFGGWRLFGYFNTDKAYYNSTFYPGSFQAKANLANNSGNSYYSGTGIGLWGLPDEPGIRFTYRDTYTNDLSNKGELAVRLGTQGAKSGLYGYRIKSTFQANFKCYTQYSRSYDPVSGQFVTGTEMSPYQPLVRLEPYVNLCYNRKVGGDYFEASCGDSLTPVYARANCPNGLGTEAQVNVTGELPPITPLNGILSLTVTSTLDNVSTPGTNITQVGSAIAVDKNGVAVSPTAIVTPLGGGDFGGMTNYNPPRTTNRNFRVTLQADTPHTSRASGSFTNWAECDAPYPQGQGRNCTVTLIFDSNGGQSKTITANYTSVLPTPTLTVTTPPCEAGYGKAYITWGAVTGADTYKLYKGGTVDFVPVDGASGNQVDADGNSANGIQSFSSAQSAFTLAGLAVNQSYFYKVRASAAPGASSQNGVASGKSSNYCAPTVALQVKQSGSADSTYAKSISVPYNSSGVVLKWTGKNEPTNSCEVYSDVPTTWTGFRDVSATARTETVSSLSPSGVYTFYIRCQNPVSSWEDTVVVKIDPNPPDLTANVPVVEGIKVGNSYISRQSLKLRGFINNAGVGPTTKTNTTSFRNTFQYAAGSLPTTDAGWGDLADSPLITPMILNAGVSNQEIASYTWAPNASIATGNYHFRVCADRPPLPNGNEPESNTSGTGETNNCGPAVSISVVDVSSPTVDLMFNGLLQGAGGQYSPEWNTGGYFTWDTLHITPGSCVASAQPAHGSWTGGKPDTNQSTTAFTIANLQNNYDFKLTCNGLTGSAVPNAWDTVRIIPLSVSCSADKAKVNVGEVITWTATVNAASQSTLSWGGDEGLSGATNPISKVYTTVGPKGATVTATTNGVSKTASCTVPGCTGTGCGVTIEAYPDLTTTVSVKDPAGTTIAPNTVATPHFITGQFSVNGTVANSGDAKATPGTFSNLFHYSNSAPTSDPATVGGDWAGVSLSSTGDLIQGTSRSVVANPWTPQLGGPWYFSLCADERTDGVAGYSSANGVVPEKNPPAGENNNCSSTGPYYFANQPALTVKSTHDGAPSTGVVVAGSQTGTGGPTEYTAKLNAPITTDLTAPWDDVNTPKGRFVSWTNCDSTAFAPGDSTTTGSPKRVCHADVALNGAKTVTANYITPIDGATGCTLEGRQAGTSNAWQSGALNQITIPVNSQAELHWKSVGSLSPVPVSSDPATTWTGTRPISSTLQTETVATALSQIGVYTFRLTCSNQVSIIPQLVVFNVIAPDLTANVPTVTGTKIGNLFVAKQAITLAGSINNVGTASTPNGTFNNAYQYSTNANTATPTWAHFATVYLTSATPVGVSELNRAIGNYTWGQDGSISPGKWFFRTCADRPTSQVAEANTAGNAETDVSNCSASVEVNISSAPTLTVKSTRSDLESSTNPSINPPGVTISGSQLNTGGVTRYSVVKIDGTISTVLTAPLEDTANPKAKFIGWTCTGGTANDVARTCAVDVATGENKTVTANYKTPFITKTDIELQGREVGTTAWSNSFDILFYKNVELQWRSASGRCTSGTPTSNPTTSWTNATPKTVTAAFSPSERITTPSPFAIGTYTFEITCTDAQTGSSAKDTVVVRTIGPDLTANVPTVTGTKIGNLFVAKQAITLAGSINNRGTAPTPNGTFNNAYQYSTNANTATPTWAHFATVYLTSSAPVGVNELNRALGNYTWGQDGSISPGKWFFRTCADKPNSQVVEANTAGNAETDASNCSASVEVNISSAPTLTVKSTRNGLESSTNPSVNPPGVTISGSQPNTGGVTRYSVVKIDGTISTTLTAPATDPTGAKFISWTPRDATNCAGTSSDATRTCAIDVAVGESKTVTANYQKIADSADLVLEHRKAGTNDAYVTTDLTMLFTEGDQLRWYSPTGRCDKLTASVDWSGDKATTGTSIANAPTETITPLPQVRVYTFTLTCVNNITGTSFPKSVKVNVTAPDLTANVPTASGAKIGTQFVAKQPITLNGSINNIGNAGTPPPINGTFNNVYQFSTNAESASPVWADFATVYLQDTSAVGANQTRALQSYVWGQNSTPGTWYFRVCADKPLDQVRESNELNNCSTNYVKVPISNAPQVIVKSTLTTSAGVKSFITGVPITGTQTGSGGSTNYTISFIDKDVNTTLTAPARYPDVPTGAKFISWTERNATTGCKGGSDVAGTCDVSATVGEVKEVVANYKAQIDIPFDLDLQGREAGTATWSKDFTIGFNKNIELQWRSESGACTSGPADSAPSISAWSGTKTITTAWKNETFTAPFSVTNYTFGLTCTDPVTGKTIRPTVIARVVAPDLTATAPNTGNATPNAACSAPVPGTTDKCFDDTTVTLSGSTITNGGTASTPNGTFRNAYEYTTNGGGNWYDFVDYGLADTSALIVGGTRAVPSHTWGGVSAGPLVYQFRTCADQVSDSTQGYTAGAGSIPEANTAGTGETNNCSSGTPGITFVARPAQLKNVDIRFNGLQGPVTIPYNSAGDIWWNAENYATCTASAVASDTNWNSTWPPNTPAQTVRSTNRTSITDYKISCNKITNALGTSPQADTVRVIPLSVSCSGNKATGFVDDSVTWTATAQGGNGTYTYYWSGTDALSYQNGPKASATDAVTKTYTLAGSKNASVYVTSDQGQSTTATCAPTANIQASPDLTATAPIITGSTPVAGVSNQYYEGTTLTLKDAYINNVGTGPTTQGTFRNLYQYTTNGGTNWSDFVDYSMSDIARGGTASMSSHTWGQGNSIAASSLVYQFRTCADQQVDATPGYTSGAGTVSENNRAGNAETEGSNCSPATSGVTIVARPLLKVDLKVNGQDGTIELPSSPAQSPMLSWVTNFSGYATPDSCTASLDWTGAKTATGGTEVVGPLTAKTTYTYKIVCTKAGALLAAEDTVVVRIAPVVSCRADRSPVFVGETVTWTATVNSVATYTLSWAGDENLSGFSASLQKSYASAGEKTAVVSVSADGITKTAQCLNPVGDKTSITVRASPDLTANTPLVTGSTSVAGVSNQYYEGTTLTLKDAYINNVGTGPTTQGTFRNLYQYTTNGGTNWSDFVDYSMSDIVRGGTASMSSHTWGQGGALVASPLVYQFRTCADQKVDATPGYTSGAGTVPEDNRAGTAETEGSNCSPATSGVTIVARPLPLTVALTFENSTGPVTTGYNATGDLRYTVTNASTCDTPVASVTNKGWTDATISPDSSGSATGRVTSSALTQSTLFTLTCTPKTGAIDLTKKSVSVKAIPLSVSCAVSPSTIFVGESATWTATPLGGNNIFTYSWSGTDSLSGTTKAVTKTYTNTGSKTATVTVVSDGASVSALCLAPTLTVQSSPDLTATAPVVDGTQIGGTFIAGYPITLKDAQVRNDGTASATIGSSYRTLYQFAARTTAPAQNIDWFDLPPDSNFGDTSALATGASRTVPSMVFPASSAASGTYWFRVCADQKADSSPGYVSSVGTVPEDNLAHNAETEASNCSSAVRVPVLNAPSLTVQSTLDGSPALGASILGVSGTPNMGGTTVYSKVTTSPIDVVLEAGSFSMHGFLDWGTGCNADAQTTGKRCHVTLGVGEAKILTANYESLPDITLEGRIGSGAWSTEPVVASYNDAVELRFRGYRCDSYKATSAAGTAVSSPTTTWANVSKTINNTAFTSETVSALTGGSYTFTLSCSNKAGSVSKTVTVNVGNPPVSCSASPIAPVVGQTVTWTVVAPVGSTYSWSGGAGGDAVSGTTNPVTKVYSTLGTKTANVTITVNGRTNSGTCTVPVAGLPDLTANVPTVTGDKLGNEFIAQKPLTISGAIDNEGTVETPNRLFRTLYQYSTDNRTWSDFVDVPLTSTSVFSAGEVNRAVSSYTWGEDGSIASGTWYFRTCADQKLDGALGYTSASGSINEYAPIGDGESEASNCSSSMRIDITSLPDLSVSRAPAPVQTGTLRHGTTYTFDGIVRNSGSGAISGSSSFTNTFQVILSSEISGATVTLPNSPVLTGLGVNETKTVTSGGWSAVAGTHTLKLCADEPGSITEASETNNCSTATVDIYPQAPAVSATTGTCPNGQIFLSYSGGVGAETFELWRAEGSASATYTLQETSATLAELRTIDNGLTPGTMYYYYIKAVGPDRVTSTATPTNATAKSGCTENKPDLVVTAVGVNGTLTAGTSLTFTGTVRNSGGVDVQNGTGFENQFTLTQNGQSVTTLAPLSHSSGLSAGTSVDKASSAWQAVAGTYKIQFCAGTPLPGAITELDETTASNCKDTDFTVQSAVPSHKLTVTVVGNGTVTSNTGGIDCTAALSPCTATFAEGTSVILTEAPGSSSFTGWSGGTCTGTASSCSFSMNSARTVTATFSGGTPPPGRTSGSDPTLSCGVSPSQGITQTVTSVNWTALPSGGSGLYRQFVYEFDNDNLPSGAPNYEERIETSVRSSPTPSGYSYAKTYPTTGMKLARVKVIDSNMKESAMASCPSITVGQLCPATESNFTLSPSRTTLWLATDGSAGISAIISLTPSGNCPAFSSQVNLTAKAENSSITDNGTLTFTGSGNSNRRSAYYDSEAPNSSTARNALTSTPFTYTEGAEVSFRRRVQGNQSIAEGTYPFQVCGNTAGRPELCVSLNLQVSATPPTENPTGSGSATPIQYEEF